MAEHYIKNSDMNKSVRLIGSAIRKVSPYFKEETFYKQNKTLDRFMKGHWLSRKTAVKTTFIERKNGSKLRVIVCRAKNEGEADTRVTGLLWMHGGGYASGLPEQDCLFADLFCHDGSCVAVLPDYTRSVDAPYPASLHDCYLALQWMWKHADELGIDSNQIFVGGESAGGGLTAAVCLYARDKGHIPIAFQLPLYPMLDDREITKSSQNNDAPIWNTKSNRTGWNLYLQSIDGSDKVPCYAAPARATDYFGLPPACTYVGTIEPFYDETVAYFEELKKAGIPVHLKKFEGCFHAFDLIAYPTKPAQEARKFLVDTFRYAQKNYRSGTT
jgi:acetyl esterase/lipase